MEKIKTDVIQEEIKIKEKPQSPEATKIGSEVALRSIGFEVIPCDGLKIALKYWKVPAEEFVGMLREHGVKAEMGVNPLPEDCFVIPVLTRRETGDILDLLENYVDPQIATRFADIDVKKEDLM